MPQGELATQSNSECMSNEPCPANLSDAIARNLPCASCGYDLIGLSFDGSCPECHHSCLRSWAKATSSRSAGLPAWLAVLRQLHAAGCALIAIMLTAIIFLPRTWVIWIPANAVWGLILTIALLTGPLVVLCAKYDRWRLPICAAILALLYILICLAFAR